MNYIKNLNKITGRNIIVYYSGWLTNNNHGNSINDFDKNGFMSVVHELNFNDGLDLLLHTPGGSVSATESIIDYLHEIFGTNIRAIVPQMAMSGGTMIACSCKEIVMGKQSSLGPIDPQLNGLPAHGIIGEFERAKQEIFDDPSSIPLWQTVIGKYHPTYIEECYKAIDWSEEILENSLKKCMFKDDPKSEKKIERIKNELGSHEVTKAHDRHINPKKCKKMGLKITMMEDDDKLQDAILSVHHACINLMNKEPISKIIMNQNEKVFIQKVSK